MKKIIVAFVFILISSGAFAQQGAFPGIRYQTMIQDGDGKPVPGTKAGLRLTIIQGDYKQGTSVYSELQSPTTDSRGIADLIIGMGTVLQGDFSSIDWLNGPFWVKTEVNTPAQSSFSSSGTEIVSYGLLPGRATQPGPIVSTPRGTKPVKGKHYLGEFYGGGIIFYINSDSGKIEHGLVVGLQDLSSACIWSNVTLTLIGPEAESTSNGRANTKAIVEQEDHKRSAALLCDTSTVGGHNDWYLPSLQELNILWNNLYIVNRALNADGNPETVPFDQAAYWSSTEDEATTFAWYFGMFDAGDGGDPSGKSDKSELYHVRAIRAF